MPSPLALGGLGRLQSTSTERLAQLSTPKNRRRFRARPGTSSNPIRPLNDQQERRTQSLPKDFAASFARGELRGELRGAWGGSPRARAKDFGGPPRTAPGSARSYASANRPAAHGYAMKYRRPGQHAATQSARTPVHGSVGLELSDAMKSLAPRPPVDSPTQRHKRPQLAPLPPMTLREDSPKKSRSPRSKDARQQESGAMDWQATAGQVEPQQNAGGGGSPRRWKLGTVVGKQRSCDSSLSMTSRGGSADQPADLDSGAVTEGDKTEQPAAPVSNKWKQVQLHEQIRVLNKAQNDDEKWGAVLKPWLAKYDKAHRWPGSIEERLEGARKEQAALQEQEAVRVTKLDQRAHRLLDEIQFLVSRKVSKYHTAHQIQKELATMNAFVAQQQRKRITSRGMLDRILGVHEMMVEELFMEMDDDGSGVLDEGEILAMSVQLGHRLSASELRDAMAAMDEDGSGEVDFREFYGWWGRGDKDSLMMADRSGDYYTIVPH